MKSDSELQKLRYDNKELREASDRLCARIEALEKHKRLQMEDIMNLGAALGQAQVRIEALEAALLWVADIADINYEQDQKLRSEGARTLKRISDHSRAVIAQSSPPSQPPQRLDTVEEIAKALLMEGRITPNTARALMAKDGL